MQDIHKTDEEHNSLNEKDGLESFRKADLYRIRDQSATLRRSAGAVLTIPVLDVVCAGNDTPDEAEERANQDNASQTSATSNAIDSIVGGRRRRDCWTSCGLHDECFQSSLMLSSTRFYVCEFDELKRSCVPRQLPFCAFCLVYPEKAVLLRSALHRSLKTQMFWIVTTCVSLFNSQRNITSTADYLQPS